MGIDAYTPTYWRIQEGPVGQAIDALYRQFQATPSAQREGDQEEDWALFREYCKRKYEELDLPGGHFRLGNDICIAIKEGAPHLLSHNMLGAHWDAGLCQCIAVVLRNWVSAHPPRCPKERLSCLLATIKRLPLLAADRREPLGNLYALQDGSQYQVSKRYSKHQQRWLWAITKDGHFVPDTSTNDHLLCIAGQLEAVARRGEYVYFC